MARAKKNIELLPEPKKEDIDLENVKKELKKYVQDEIQKGYFSEIEKVNKKLLHEKNKRIIFKNFVILFLLLLCCFLVYLLFSNGYFEKYLNRPVKEEIKDNVSEKQENDNKDNKDDKKQNNKSEDEPKKEEKQTLEDLQKEYGGLLDNYVLNEKSNYLADFSKGILSSKLKKYYVLNSMNFDNLTKEEDTNMIPEDAFVLAYNKLFDDECVHESFEYDETRIKYINSLKTYISDNLLSKKASNVEREITKIEVKDDKVIIETIEGIVKDNTLFDLITKEEIGSLFNKKMSDYEDKLLKVKYTFQGKKLISLN